MGKVKAAFTGTALFLAITILGSATDTETAKQLTACKSANYIQSLQKAIRQQPVDLLSEIKAMQEARELLELAASTTDKRSSASAIAPLAAVNRQLTELLGKAEQCLAKAAETATVLATQSGKHWAIAEAAAITASAASGDTLSDGAGAAEKYAELALTGTDGSSCTDAQASSLEAKETEVNLPGLENLNVFGLEQYSTPGHTDRKLCNTGCSGRCNTPSSWRVKVVNKKLLKEKAPKQLQVKAVGKSAQTEPPKKPKAKHLWHGTNTTLNGEYMTSSRTNTATSENLISGPPPQAKATRQSGSSC
uniref:Variant surface glycoprotein n=1 Tax=Trypanosoma brucei TaxID=5691 RepID=A0A1V0FZF2_9TRYP|nr:variant surface glycoprotein [Trypanosoma brucei]